MSEGPQRDGGRELTGVGVVLATLIAVVGVIVVVALVFFGVGGDEAPQPTPTLTTSPGATS